MDWFLLWFHIAFSAASVAGLFVVVALIIRAAARIDP